MKASYASDDDDSILEFTNAPFDILPVEIHAIYKVREIMGLKTPRIEHPLMNTPFGAIPANLPEIHDPLLEGAITKVRQILPTL